MPVWGSTDLKMDHGTYGYYVRCKRCDILGPTGIIIHDAEKEWNKEMAIQDAIKDTSYRDRVDMMAAAFISGIHTVMAAKYIAAWAIKQVDAIDAEIEKRERKKQIEEVELMARLREQEVK